MSRERGEISPAREEADSFFARIDEGEEEAGSRYRVSIDDVLAQARSELAGNPDILKKKRGRPPKNPKPETPRQ